MTDIKAWLSRAKHIDDEINTLLKEQERALTRATGAVPAALLPGLLPESGHGISAG